LNKLIEKDDNPMMYLVNQAINCEKSYFIAVNIGYLLAMVCTIVVMLVFDHGQPALLYLVPGCCFAVLGTAMVKGEFK
jgi:minor histocompatibility antigen H13